MFGLFPKEFCFYKSKLKLSRSESSKNELFRLTVKYSTQEKYLNFFFFHPEKKRSTKRGVNIVRCKRPQKIL